MRTLTKHLALALCTTFVNGCIGIIQDVSQTSAVSTEARSKSIKFAGIVSANPLSHSSINVVFAPAVGTNDFDYRVYQNGLPTPVSSLSSSQVSTDPSGLINIPIKGLQLGTTYTFVVKAYDNSLSVEDTNNVQKSATTLNFKTPLFAGLNTLKNVAGINGQTQLVAQWNPAEPAANNGSSFGVDRDAISGYRIYIGKELNTISLVGSIGTTSSPQPNANQYTITGLESNTAYYVYVRAVDSNSPQNEDLNTVTLQGKTLSNEPIKFNGIKSISIPNTKSGYGQINISWDFGSGAFSRYRIFASTTARSVFDPQMDAAQAVGPDITDLSLTSTFVSVSQANALYYIAIVACSDASCSQYAGHSKVLSVRTTPPVAPFNGIKSLTQPSGSDGLNSLLASWDLPDTSLGVYDAIKIFQTDASGLYDELIDTVPQYDPANPSVIGYTQDSATTYRINSLTPGINYCFIAKAYALSPPDPTKPNGRSSTTVKKMCATPQYTMPGFLGINSGCTSPTSSTFKVSWSMPSPLGVYSYYEIYYKIGTDFSFSDAVSGSPSYSRVIATANATQHTLTNLVPGATYQIGVRTYYQDPNTLAIYRDTNLSSTGCTTSGATVDHKGWDEIVALGPKIRGLSSPPTAAYERLVVPGKDGVPAGGVDGIYRHRYPQECTVQNNCSISAGVNSSRHGIVRLVWPDFVLPASLGPMYNFNGPGNGYKVFRKSWQSSHDTVPPILVNNSTGTDASDGAWVQVSTTLIPSEIDVRNGVNYYYGEFVDYTLPEKSSASTAIYWYKVEAYLNNTRVNFTAIPADGVIKITIPTDNMGLTHRWMANKQNCLDLGKIPDRANNYRCLYSGLGNSGGYADISNSFLVDRFGLGCNFSRGSSANACVSSAAYFEGTGAVGTGTIGTFNASTGKYTGDCIGTNVDSNVSAPTGAVYYVRKTYSQWGTHCYINTSTGGYGSTWSAVESISTAISSASTTLPPSSTQFPSGRGYALTATSNNAQLAIFGSTAPNIQYFMCAAHTINHRGNPITKRTIRNREKSIIRHYGNFAGSSTSISAIIGNTFNLGSSTGNNRDCLNTFSISSIDLNSAGYVFNHLASGSSGPNSQEACVTRYGVQSFQQIPEKTADLFYCTTDGCSSRYQDPGLRNTPFTSFWDSNNQNHYYNSSDDTWYEMLFSGMSIGKIGQTATNTLAYYLPFLDLGLICGGSSCNNGSDDNTLMTLKTSGTSATTYAPSTYPTSRIHNNEGAASQFYASNLPGWMNYDQGTLFPAATGGNNAQRPRCIVPLTNND